MENNYYGAVAHKFELLGNLIGNTPMVGIRYRYKGNEGMVYAKCENYNYTGSIKDRMAYNILREAYISGAIRPGDHIVEVTSGNTGIAMSAIGRALGHRVSIIMPDWMSKERKDIIRSMGAEIILVSKEQGGFLGSIALSEKMAAESSNVFLPQQFVNEHNPGAHYRTTGLEISVQMQKEGIRPDVFVAGVGTGGTVMGAGMFLREMYNVKVHPLEPEESPTLSTGYKVGAHRIQGISDDFIPEIVKLDRLDEVVSAASGDGIIMAQKLARTFGMALGISSGANLVGAIKLQQKYGMDKVVATVFADCNKKYLSTDLMNEEPVVDSYIAPGVELLDFISLPKAF